MKILYEGLWDRPEISQVKVSGTALLKVEPSDYLIAGQSVRTPQGIRMKQSAYHVPLNLIANKQAATASKVVSFSSTAHPTVSITEINELEKHLDRSRAHLEQVEKMLLRLKKRGKARQQGKIFNPIVNEDELANCFYHLYTVQEGVYDDLQFAAYLYLLVKKEKLGNDTFATRGQTKFYAFVQQKVLPDLNKTTKAFGDRLRKLDFLVNPKNLSDMFKSTSPDWKNFQNLLANFRNTSFYHYLKSLK